MSFFPGKDPAPGDIPACEAIELMIVPRSVDLGGFAVRRALLYGKGPLVLHAIRKELERHTGNLPDGDRLFVTWLRRILADHRFQVTRTRDVVAILEELTAKPWRPWFERYVFGGEMPAVE